MVLSPDIGDTAPEFALPGTADDGVAEYRLSGHLDDGPVVLAFYAFDFHPSCTEELCDIRDLEWFGLMDGVTVFGLSTDRAFSHAAFAREYGLDFPLLSDSDGGVSEAYGVLYDEVKGHRRVSKRAIIIVDKTGGIRYRWVADELAQQPDWREIQAVLPVTP